MGSGAESYMRKGFLIYEKMRKYLVIQYMRRPLVIMTLLPSRFSCIWGKLCFLFYQCVHSCLAKFYFSPSRQSLFKRIHTLSRFTFTCSCTSPTALTDDQSLYPLIHGSHSSQRVENNTGVRARSDWGAKCTIIPVGVEVAQVPEPEF